MQEPVEIDINQIKANYFSDPHRRVFVPKGAVLMRQGQINQRLYLVLSGSMTAYMSTEGGEDIEIFRATQDMFVGVYSFFSHNDFSFATIVAAEDSELAFLELNPNAHDPEQQGTFARHFLPIIVNELAIRQVWARRVALEKENTLKQLMHSEKMAMLGQLAAGLAHELNNAVGVLQRKTEWLSEEMTHYLKEKDQRGMFRFFEEGRDKGQFLSSVEVREKRKELETRFQIASKKARKLARIGLPDEVLAQYARLSEDELDRMNYYWEIGSSFHDMLLAAKHAVHVVKSVKQLGVADPGRVEGISLNETIQEALSLLKSQLRKIKVVTDLAPLPGLLANSGELVQIWLNLIKNGYEALMQAATPSPRITITTALDEAQQVLVVSITDNGPGVPENLQEKIFQPSFSTKKDGLTFGLGLGLAIVQQLVESYQGQITLTSQPGATTFKITLPYGKT